MKDYPMDATLYSKLAIRTSPRKDQMVHCVLGIASELSELYEGNYIEELGDVCWYLNEGCDFIGVDLMDLDVSEGGLDPLRDLSDHLGKLADLVKRHEFYKKDLDHGEVFILLSKMYSEVLEICNDYEIDIDEVLEKNILKLKTRYPLKFEEEKAVNRNLEEERKIFEN